MRIEFDVLGVAVPQGSASAFPNRKTGGVVVVTKSKKLKAWRKAVSEAATAVSPPTPCPGAFSVSICFSFLRPKSRKAGETMMTTRPDIDKLIRAVLDACTGIIWHDDSQVCMIHAEKVYGMLPPKAMVRVVGTENPLVWHWAHGGA